MGGILPPGPPTSSTIVVTNVVTIVSKIERMYVQHLPNPCSSFFGTGFWSVLYGGATLHTTSVTNVPTQLPPLRGVGGDSPHTPL